MEKYYVFLKNNRVVNIAVFLEPDEHLAAQIAAETGCEDAIWVGEDKPAIYSYWNGTSFEAPTDEYLISIGVLEAKQIEETIEE